MTKLRALSIDAEFTSFDMYGGDMIALGVVEILDDLTLGREHVMYFRPTGPKYFTEKAREVHGISYFKASQFPEAKHSCIEFLKWLEPLMDQFPLPVAFYGSWDFDRKWIEMTMQKNDMQSSYWKAFGGCEKINVYKMAKDKLRHMPLPKAATEDESKKGQYKLDNVAKFYKIPHSHHEALSDARANAQIYINIIKGIDTWTGELF